MSTQTMTLAEFLLARVPDEERALVPRWHHEMCEWEMRSDVDPQAECDCSFEARRRFWCATVDAKRRIVELHRPDADHAEGHCGTCWDDTGAYCPTLRLLALPYAHHPDYRDEWSVR